MLKRDSDYEIIFDEDSIGFLNKLPKTGRIEKFEVAIVSYHSKQKGDYKRNFCHNYKRSMRAKQILVTLIGHCRTGYES